MVYPPTCVIVPPVPDGLPKYLTITIPEPPFFATGVADEPPLPPPPPPVFATPDWAKVVLVIPPRPPPPLPPTPFEVLVVCQLPPPPPPP